MYCRAEINCASHDRIAHQHSVLSHERGTVRPRSQVRRSRPPLSQATADRTTERERGEKDNLVLVLVSVSTVKALSERCNCIRIAGHCEMTFRNARGSTLTVTREEVQVQIAYFVFLRRKLSGKGIVCPVLNKSCAKRGALPHSTRKRGQFPGLPSSLPSPSNCNPSVLPTACRRPRSAAAAHARRQLAAPCLVPCRVGEKSEK